MKTIFTKFLALGSIALFMLASCKKDEVKVVATSGSVGALSASSSTIVLSKANLTGTAVTFNWGAADFGFKAATTSVLQIDKKGNSFAAPKEFNMGTGTLTQSFNTVDFNALLLAMSLPTGTASQVEVRIKSALNSVTATYSNVLSLTVTPFALVSYVYVPGAYQGWNPASADSLMSPTGNGVYTGIINYVGGDLHFKITPQKKWDVAYGTAGGNAISTSGGDITAPAAGLNMVTVDLNANTITFAAVPFYYSIIGDAAPGTAWTTDTDMKYNNGTQKWELTTALTAGAFKVRRNHDWGSSYGILKPTPDGVTLDSSNDDNIPVPTAGTYKITFAIKATDNTKATYTLVKQ
jgi:hypothetical protein